LFEQQGDSVMKSKTVKRFVMVALTGTLLQFGGCLGTWFSAALQGLPGTILAEFLLDNDSIFDLFEDGNVAAQ
jgi:hypothetical protein